MSIYPAQRQENTVIIDPSVGVNSSTNQWLSKGLCDIGGQTACMSACMRVRREASKCLSDLCPTPISGLIDGLKLVLKSQVPLFLFIIDRSITAQPVVGWGWGSGLVNRSQTTLVLSKLVSIQIHCWMSSQKAQNTLTTWTKSPLSNEQWSDFCGSRYSLVLKSTDRHLLLCSLTSGNLIGQ